jgi:uncharacterized protein
MDIEFDTVKDAANLAKHGVSLAFGARVFEDDDHIVLSSIRPIDGEDRFKAVGMIGDTMWTAVHVYREAIRMISVRRSNAGEERAYHRDSG